MMAVVAKCKVKGYKKFFVYNAKDIVVYVNEQHQFKAGLSGDSCILGHIMTETQAQEARNLKVSNNITYNFSEFEGRECLKINNFDLEKE